ncbi:hypothetical protein BH10BDE1_BH10BDE1_14820 [soil metagenome]
MKFLTAFAFILSTSIALASPVTKTGLTVEEAKLWRQDRLLQSLAKKMNPLARPAGDGALGLNLRFPEKVLVDHQLEGWNWIRAGVALGNGFIVDRGIMTFEWAFARMNDAGPNEGSFGESKTVEIANFLGLYARAVLLLRSVKMEERVKRLERLIPRLEASLRSPRSLLGERRWDAAEKRSWVTSQRIQAAAAAYWIGRLLTNPGLKRTADLWLADALKRQEANGRFPSTVPGNLKSAAKLQIDSLETLQGLAWADASYGLRLKEPIAKGFKWLEASKAPLLGSPLTFATYAAWTKNPFALKVARKKLL